MRPLIRFILVLCFFLGGSAHTYPHDYRYSPHEKLSAPPASKSNLSTKIKAVETEDDDLVPRKKEIATGDIGFIPCNALLNPSISGCLKDLLPASQRATYFSSPIFIMHRVIRI